MRDRPDPKKRFGQHFLHDRHVVQRIVDSFAPAPGEAIVEIGPGLGALTGELLRRAREMHAVELDRDLIARLEADCAALGTLHLHQADALTFPFCGLARPGERLRLIGNLPYNISTPLLFRLFAQIGCIRDMCFMLQKEVVDRLAAEPDTSDYGRLSVMTQIHCRVEPLFNVGSGAFTPPPKVDSAVVRLVPHPAPPVAIADFHRFADVVRLAFAQRRKTLRNSLRGMIDAEVMVRAGVDPVRRAETLSLAEFAALANAPSN